MIALKYIYVFSKSFIHWLFKINGSYQIAADSTVNTHSYRLQKKSATDILLPLKYYKKAIVTLLRNHNSGKTIGALNNIGILNTKEYAQVHLYNITGKKASYVINRDSPSVKGRYLSKFIIISFVTTLLPFIFTLSLLYRTHRGNLSLMLLEVSEHLILAHSLIKNNINYIYFIGCSFEKDANMMALFFNFLTIKSHKVPSSNPIHNYYDKVFAYAFSFSSPFQIEEYQKLKINWYVNQFYLWPCYNFIEMKLFYSNKQTSTPAKIIGFLSSGVWRRIERGDSIYGIGAYEAETTLMLELKKIIAKNNLRLLIYLHPCEKETDVMYEKARQYYFNYFENDNIEFTKKDTPSWKAFDLCNIAISVYSSSNIERLYCGFKTLYAPLNMKENPYGGTSINNITITKKEDVEKKILETLLLTENDFFKKNNLLGYRYIENTTKYTEEISATLL